MPTHLPTYGSTLRHQPASEARKDGVLRLTASSMLTALVAVILMGSTWREFAGNENIVAILEYQVTIAEPILAVLILLAATIVAEGRVPKSILLYASLAFMMIFSLSLVRGFLVDPQKALFFARLYIIIPLSLIIASSLKTKYIDVSSIVNVIFFFGILLSIICYFKALTGFLITDAHGRALFSWATFAIVAALFVSIIYRRSILFNRYPNAFALLFLGAIVLSGQGTALVATVLVSLMLFLTGRGSTLPQAVRMMVLILGLAALLAFGPLLMADLTEQSSLSAWAEQRAGTSRARQLVWTAFLDAFGMRTFFDKMIGLPMGQTDIIVLSLGGNRTWNHSLHNAYLEVLAFSGFFGLTFFVFCIAALVSGSVRLFFQPVERRMARAAATYVLAMLTFGLSYDFRADAALLLLMPILLTRASSRSATNQPQPVRRPRAALA